jgi:hypothetical protein
VTKRGKEKVLISIFAMGSSWGITKSKGHYFSLKEPFFSFNYCNPLAIRVDSDVIVSVFNVKLEHKFSVFHWSKMTLIWSKGYRSGTVHLSTSW